MKILTYRRRNPNASAILTFGTEQGDIVLRNDIPTPVEDTQESYLSENSEEYQICVKREIITVKSEPGSIPEESKKESDNVLMGQMLMTPELPAESSEESEEETPEIPIEQKTETLKTTTLKNTAKK